MARTAGREPKFHIKPLIDWMGVGELINQVGVKRIIDEIGLQRIIDEVESS